MKRVLFFISLLIMSLLLYDIVDSEAKEPEVEAVVESYFECLRSGDTTGILNLITDPLLSERRELLEKNTAYPQFLREMYNNSYIKIINIRKIKGDKRAADVEVYLNNGETPLKTRFILQNVNGSWKISDEVNDA